MVAMTRLYVGDTVMRLDTGFHGEVVDLDFDAGRARVKWPSGIRTWMRFKNLTKVMDIKRD